MKPEDNDPDETSQKSHLANSLLIAILGGIILTFPLFNVITPLVLGERSFTGRSTAVKVLIVFAICLTIAALLFALLFALQKVFKFRIGPDKVLDLTTHQRYFSLIIFIGSAVAMIYFLNNVFGYLNCTCWEMVIEDPFPLINPVGVDFRTGIYADPKMVLEGHNIYVEMHSNYPPFSNIFFMPLQLLNENAAYIVDILLLFAANIVTLVLITVLVRDVILVKLKIEERLIDMMAIFLFFTILFYTFSSYGFLFSIERGNYDSIAMMFSVLAIYTLIKKPDSLWLQVIFLSIATHLKIYPAALFLALFVKHGKKMILPSLAVNALMLVSLGFRNAYLFIDVMTHYTATPYSWIGNHSGFSFAEVLFDANETLDDAISSLPILLSILPLVIWTVTSGLVIKFLKGDLRLLYLTMVSIPLMCTLPTVSHDYKLILMSVAFLIMIGVLIYKLMRTAKAWDALHLLAFFALAIIIGRSYVLYPEASLFINNKYTPLLVIALLMIPGLRSLRDLQIADEGTSAPDFQAEEAPAEALPS